MHRTRAPAPPTRLPRQAWSAQRREARENSLHMIAREEARRAAELLKQELQGKPDGARKASMPAGSAKAAAGWLDGQVRVGGSMVAPPYQPPKGPPPRAHRVPYSARAAATAAPPPRGRSGVATPSPRAAAIHHRANGPPHTHR
jgi:hypothetical protein